MSDESTSPNLHVDVHVPRDGAPSLRIRSLHPQHDFDFVTRIFDEGADYWELERGVAPSAEAIREFFEGCPRSKSPEDKLVLGFVEPDDRDVGAVELLRGYPEPTDWYIGLLLVDAAARGRGIGACVVEWIVELAREHEARRLFVCPIEDNHVGRAFWASRGFVLHREVPPMEIGKKRHWHFELVRALT